jgi:plastocyanin
MLLYLAKVTRTPYLTTRGPDVVSPVTNPMTVTQGSPVQLSATINHAWTSNNYAQNVAAAEYYIGTPPWAGGTGIAMQAEDGAFDEQTEPVQATINTGSIPPGTYVVFVRGRGVNSYEGNLSWGPVSATWLTGTGGGGTATATATQVVPSPTALGCGIDTYDVSIVDFDYQPMNMLIRMGSTIRWTNNGQVAHTTTSDTGVWDSGVLNPGEQFAITFNTGTVFEYHCTIHPNMTGTIVVVSNCPTVTLPVPTATRIASVTRTGTVLPTPSFTHGPPTNTPTGTLTPGTPTFTPTPCAITFSDVPPSHTFYENIRCLACRGIISGYSDGTFRPGNDITRGQIAKMVSNAAGFVEPVDGQSFEDVPFGSPFYVFIERLYGRGHMGGYQCGLRESEPCVPPANRPYFRPNESATRGQISKIVSNAAGFVEPVSGQFYADVTADNPFYSEIMRLTVRGVMSGYPCGTVAHEPCDGEQRPYFRWGNTVTRGQASKIVANTFYPGCVTPLK